MARLPRSKGVVGQIKNGATFLTSGSVSGDAIALGTITSKQLADAAVDARILAPNIVDATHLDLTDDYEWLGAHSQAQTLTLQQDIDVAGDVLVEGLVDGRDVAADGATLDLLQITNGVAVHDLLLGLADDDHPQYILEDGTRAFSGDIDLGGSDITNVLLVDGRDLALDGIKLDGIENGAAADQTASEIKTLYESNADTNEFSDAEQSKLAGIDSGATDDLTGAEIKTLYELEADTNAFTDSEKTKLGTVETGAAADQTDTEIRTAYNNEVAQVSISEKNNGTSLIIKRYTPKDIADMAIVHGGEVEEAPIDGSTYVRVDAGWTLETGAGGSGGSGTLVTGISYHDSAVSELYITFGVDTNWEALHFVPGIGDTTTGASQTGTKPTTLGVLQGLSYS